MIDKHSMAIGLVKAKKNNLINIFQRMKSPAVHSHSYTYINKHTIDETNIFQGAKQKPAHVYDDYTIKVFTPKFLNRITIYNMQQLLTYTLGERYGLPRIPLMALDCMFNTYFFTRRFSIGSFKVCSNRVAWVYAKAPTVEVTDSELYNIAMGKLDHEFELDYKFLDVSWKQVTPDMINDHCEESKDFIQVSTF